MPVMDSIAPITPSTPSEIVATREGNRAQVELFVPSLDVERQPSVQSAQRALYGRRQLPRIAVRAHHQPGLTQRAIAGWEETSPARIFGEVRIFPVFHNAHHLYRAPRPRSLKYPPSAFTVEPKSLAANSPIYDGHARRSLVVMPGEGPARQQALSAPLEDIRERCCSMDGAAAAFAGRRSVASSVKTAAPLPPAI